MYFKLTEKITKYELKNVQEISIQQLYNELKLIDNFFKCYQKNDKVFAEFIDEINQLVIKGRKIQIVKETEKINKPIIQKQTGQAIYTKNLNINVTKELLLKSFDEIGYQIVNNIFFKFVPPNQKFQTGSATFNLKNNKQIQFLANQYAQRKLKNLFEYNDPYFTLKIPKDLRNTKTQIKPAKNPLTNILPPIPNYSFPPLVTPNFHNPTNPLFQLHPKFNQKL